MRQNNQKAKTKFRASKAWKDFRDKIRHEQITDPITGAKLGRCANLHHLDLDESHYEDISDESHFVFLNQLSHKVVHYFFSRKEPKRWRKRVLALIRILKSMEDINTQR